MISDFRVDVLIPVNNNAKLVSSTLESVKKQTFDKDKLRITIVDNHSGEGVYKDLLKYAAHGIGVYQLKNKVTSKEFVIEACSFYKILGGRDGFIVLQPGDTIEPECIQKCVDEYFNNIQNRPSLIVFETKIQDESEEVKEQEPLFLQQRMISGKDTWEHCGTRGNDHKVMCFFMGGINSDNRMVLGRGLYDYTNWMKKSYWFYGNILYLPESMACINEANYVETLDDLLELYAQSIGYIRTFPVLMNEELDDNIKDKHYKNLALNALSGCRKSISMNQYKVAEKFLLMSEVIYPDIVNKEEYLILQDLIQRSIFVN